MRIIKRYPNRKLYDTQSKGYITLDGIANLVRQGEDIQVIDHESGEDLTNVTLTQIIMESERNKTSFVPRSVLTNLIRSGTDTLDTLKGAVMASIGAMAHVEEDINQRIRGMVERGELAEEDAAHLREDMISRARDLASQGEALINRQVEELMGTLDLPTHSDIRRLRTELANLEKKLAVLEHQNQPTGQNPSGQADQDHKALAPDVPQKEPVSRKSP
ncbi:MAG: pesticidal protein Cry15Aa [Chloroflexi bacterium]|nr:pesticidal protein Cry15Aa [Chloroflexota bacterium]